MGTLQIQPKTVENLDFWKEPDRQSKSADLRISAKHLPMLRNQGMDFQVMINDIDQLIQQEEQDLSSREIFTSNFVPNNLTLNEYHNLDEIYAYINSVASLNSNISKLIQIGTTFEKRQILGLRVRPSGDWSKKLPSIVVHGLIHSREWITGAAVLDLIDKIVVKKTFQQTMSKLEFYFIPVLNPDGYVYTWNTDRLWRKTRSGPTGNFQCFGTDANRNFGFKWQGPFSSSNPCAEDFRGIAPFSEIEIRSLAKFLHSISSSLRGYFDLHAYGKHFVYPFAYTRLVEAPEAEKMSKLARLAVSRINNLPSGQSAPFSVGSVARSIYNANGATIDYVKAVLNVTYTYALELGPSQHAGVNGFLLPQSRISEALLESSTGLFTVFEAIARGE
uniref:Peptidase M14 carboxypeptidase A domain-containing protein n=2 Tax=Acrobeloides nanus TaxID=290746 RepID=A0A914CE10_9BILA